MQIDAKQGPTAPYVPWTIPFVAEGLSPTPPCSMPWIRRPLRYAPANNCILVPGGNSPTVSVGLSVRTLIFSLCTKDRHDTRSTGTASAQSWLRLNRPRLLSTTARLTTRDQQLPQFQLHHQLAVAHVDYSDCEQKHYCPTIIPPPLPLFTHRGRQRSDTQRLIDVNR